MLMQSFRMAFSSITSNKMRSFLTMLGIIIGIMAVVVLVSIVTSATDSIMGELDSLGADKLTVTVLNQRGLPLTLKEVSGYPDEYDSIAYVAPTARQSATAKTSTKEADAMILGTTSSYMEVEDLKLQAGRFLKSPDLENNSSVAVIGPSLANDLFSTVDVVGKTFYVGGRGFTIIGVLETAGESLLGSTNSAAIVPFTLAERMFRLQGISSFTVKAADSTLVAEAEDDLKHAMTARFKDESSFSVLNQSALLSSLDSIQGTLTLMLGGIAAISLLVGGIGIMNIMLVSVAERTREIGIRKAIGASRKRILTQFLIESLVLSTVGGLLGLLVSWGLLGLVSYVMDASYTMSPDVAVLAVVFSMVVGLIFGINPANKAAKMPPIEALRTE
ncbi:ABC transporter permease [Christensenellaceae bacterium OttesenSCG-928-K19]|nr:ABC transporter permease [Christensenellaceae bacterium OttesenSCG-928-K19]